MEGGLGRIDTLFTDSFGRTSHDVLSPVFYIFVFYLLCFVTVIYKKSILIDSHDLVHKELGQTRVEPFSCLYDA